MSNFFKKFDMNQLYKVQKFLNISKIFFSDLKDILGNIELSDSDKVICINNKLKEFEKDACI